MAALTKYPTWVPAALRRSLIAPAAVIAAGAMSLAPAHADPSTDPVAGMLNDAGAGSNGPLNNTLAGVGQSLCPMLVKPGATLASIAAQFSGNKLPPDMVGMVVGMAIQAECPGVMTSLANGQMPAALQGLGGTSGMALPFQLPGTGGLGASPLQIPGVAPAVASPLQAPGF